MEHAPAQLQLFKKGRLRVVTVAQSSCRRFLVSQVIITLQSYIDDVTKPVQAPMDYNLGE